MRHTWCGLALLLIPLTAASVATAQPVRSDCAFVRTLGTEIDRLLAAPLFTRTLAAVEISDPATGRILYARNADLLLRPASLMKLATSAAAVRAFDADAQFRMEVRAGVDAGGLADLVLRASGDPFMDAQDMTTLVDMLRARGARGIRSLVLDGAAFDTIPFGEGWMWDDEDAAFTPHMDGFLFGTGTWRLAATTRGSILRVELAPDLGIARVTSDVRIGTRTDLAVRRRRDSNEITVSGSMRAADSFRTEVSMAHPRAVFRAALVAALVRGGVPPLDSLLPPPLIDTLPVIGLITHPIGEAVQAMNTRSDNRCAEAVLRLLGARAGTGSARAGVDAVRMLLDSAGVRSEGFVQVDGSGLSSYNLGSAAAFGSLLRAMATGAQAERFRTTLARGARRARCAGGFRDVRGRGGCARRRGRCGASADWPDTSNASGVRRSRS